MEPSSPTAKVKSGGLAKRIISAFVILPVALFFIWQGGIFFAAFLAVLAFLSCIEWAKISGERRRWVGGALALLVLAGAYGLYRYQLPTTAWGGLILFAIGCFLGARSGRVSALLTGFGAIYICGSFYAAWQLRLTEPGITTFLWLCAMVVLTDVGAYASGKTIGGAKLAPRISPNKTWAGLIGAVVASSLVSVAFGFYQDSSILAYAGVGASVAVIGQLGDLLESGMKRHSGVKDSGHLIPGHGGVLDRLDGFIAASLWLFLIVEFFGDRL